ncbi:hypothetical protein WS72_21755 [Burkholderia savannae]|uniref:Uncharacterized protein n=1 Tax=Burkholderia savannae TaxID=1637837 RepID=A0ABR5T434_9BURK|nr:hypothetical protein WS72_21755 [Burkholderia savannae]
MPVRDMPVRDVPVWDAPVWDAPVWDAPAWDMPARRASVRAVPVGNASSRAHAFAAAPPERGATVAIHALEACPAARKPKPTHPPGTYQRTHPARDFRIGDMHAVTASRAADVYAHARAYTSA